MQINGRQTGNRNCFPKFQGSISGNTIRIDDGNALDFWLEITLTDDEIDELLRHDLSEEDPGAGPCVHERQHS